MDHLPPSAYNIPPPPNFPGHLPGNLQGSIPGNIPGSLPNIPGAIPSMPSRTPQRLTTVYEGRIYSLDVVQQPIRARMCGFGDKDRRPITPPPCVRLIVKDETTGKEIDVTEIDTTFFVLSVDLWNAEGTREVNLVRHSPTSPSISTATSSSYPPPPANVNPAYNPYGPGAPYGHASAYPSYYAPQQPTYNGHHGFPQYGAPSAQAYYPSIATAAGQGYYTPGAPGQAIAPQPTIGSPMQAAPGGMFTRNLIGSLSASAFKLTDPDNKLGIWFILQDLSVRTEGAFRLKMNFVDVGSRNSRSPTKSPGNSPQSTVLNLGSAPILASVFSDVFHVYSAKKFPGVIESTPLSKCFAIQGIKIPIRKDGVKTARAAAAALPSQDGHDADGEEWED